MTKAEQIKQVLIERLQRITTANGYTVALHAVLHGESLRNINDQTPAPWVALHIGQSEHVEIAKHGPSVIRTLKCLLEFCVAIEHQNDLHALENAVLREVQPWSMRPFAKLSNQIEFGAFRFTPILPGSASAMAVQEVNITYTEDLTNP